MAALPTVFQDYFGTVQLRGFHKPLGFAEHVGHGLLKRLSLLLRQQACQGVRILRDQAGDGLHHFSRSSMSVLHQAGNPALAARRQLDPP